MSIRSTTKARRGAVALAAAVGLALAAAGCSDGGDGAKKPAASASASQGGGSDTGTQEGTSQPPLAELRGADGLVLQITSAQRDSGGFVTVNGVLKNDGAKTLTIPVALRGDETEIIRHGRSLGGATLTDAKGKKRYYVLRDTDGRPLTTTDLGPLKAGESVPVYMQFPAPPATTTEVTFQLPTFASAPLKISG